MSPQLVTLLEALGARYWWGAGALSDGLSSWPRGPFDCSGFAQIALLKLGIVKPNAWGDLAAHDLAYACDPVALGHERLGDLVFYGHPEHIGHVAVCIGNGMAIGANGGGPQTKGQDPRACVQVRPVVYRNDFVTIGRLKPEYRS